MGHVLRFRVSYVSTLFKFHQLEFWALGASQNVRLSCAMYRSKIACGSPCARRGINARLHRVRTLASYSSGHIQNHRVRLRITLRVTGSDSAL